MRQKAVLDGLVIKVASRCNLNCSYCYMYNLADMSYMQQPKRMSLEVAKAIVNRVQEYCEEIKASAFEFTFHGGEPLLHTPAFFREFVTLARDRLEGRLRLSFSLQTNGTLLTDEWCRFLSEYRIRVGVSLDGPPRVHNRHRLDHAGKQTHRQVVNGLRRAQAAGLEPAILAVVDVTASPERLYTYYKRLGIRHLDFLWPDYHHDLLPVCYRTRPPGPFHTPFADWWIKLFDRWFHDKGPKPAIRFLNQIMLLILGIDKGFDGIGRRANTYLVVETDGGIEAADYLKACGDGFTKEGANVQWTTLQESMQAPLVSLHRRSHHALAAQCRTCPIVEVCGGGHLAHRYGRNRQFDNPSVYCYDLLKLITHVQETIVSKLSDEVKSQTGLTALPYREALGYFIRKDLLNVY